MNYFIRGCLRNRFLIAVVFFMLGSFYQDKCQAQSYQVTSPQGYNQGTVQINGNTAQFVNPMGYITQTATIYSNQIVIPTPQGYTAIGTTMYTVPPSPPSPPSPRVLQ